MSLSKEEKDALSDHYRNKDLYNPAEDPNQEVSTFEPKGMNCGGEMGYADGGEVAGDAPILDFGDLSAPSSGYEKASGLDAPMRPQDVPIDNPGADAPLKDALANKIAPPQAPMAMPGRPQAAPQIPPLDLAKERAAFGAPAEPQAAPAAPGKLQSDEYAQLIKYLQPGLGQRLGQGAMAGLGGLADAIETGVARAGNPGFQKNIEETQQNQKQNLIEALRGKYEAGFKNKNLEAENMRAANALAGENARSSEERKTQERGQDISSKTAAAERGIQTANQTREASQAERANDMKIVQEYSPLKPGGYTEAQRDAAAARLKAGGAAPATQTKVVGGVPYHQIGGKWFKG